MNCKEYIEHIQQLMGNNHIYQFILDKSISFSEDKILKPTTKLRKLAMYSVSKACYYNSYKIALRSKVWKYYEGYYICKGMEGLVLEHAWLVNDKGEVFDPTAINNHFEVAEYYGMEVPLNVLKVNKNSIISNIAILYKQQNTVNE